MTNKVQQVGSVANQISSNIDNPQDYRVYSPGGLSPTLCIAQGGGQTPYVVVQEKNNGKTLEVV